VSGAGRGLRWASARVLLALFAAPSSAWAQVTEPLSSQRLGRPYLFVFIAYAVVLGMIGAFVISIALRLARVEKGLRGE
jgi:hypothetical protein